MNEFKKTRCNMKKNGMNHKIILTLLFLLIGTIFISGCSGSRKEELNQKLIQGDQLLAAEKYSDAVIFFTALLETNQDNIKVMEKLEISKEMLHSRENLIEAESYFSKGKYSEAIITLEEVSGDDTEGLAKKEELLLKIKEVFTEKSRGLIELKEYDQAIAVLDEYEEMTKEDEDIKALRAEIEVLKLIPIEPEPPVIKKIIAIDAGHQLLADSTKEPLGPGSTVLKARVSSGTQGIVSKVPEYIVNLEMALKLKDKLIAEGYEVVMIRETHDVSISNKERAEIANNANADLFIRIHANGSSNTKVKGVETIYPSPENPYVGSLSESSKKISTLILDEIVKSSGAENRGAIPMDNMSGLNWSKVPVTIIETGYMSNKDEDKLLITSEYQDKLVQGMVNGIKLYFAEN
jgi:N-acetylmuramoyl-L-alanine amidase